MSDSPAIRFKGFTDPWEQRKFSDVFDFMRNNTLSRAELSDSEGSVLNVHYGDVLIKFGEVLDAEVESLPRIADDSLAVRLSCQNLTDGDVIIADTAEDEAVGKCSELRGCDGKEIVSGLHTMACRPLFEFAPGYLGYYLNSPAFHDQLLPLMQGIKVISVSKAAISDAEIRFPSLPEQAAVGASLSSLDNLITLHQCKYDKLVVLKKALLEKMFPRDGSDVPEIRFAGFTDPWEQRKLGELASEFRSGEFISAEKILESGPYPVYGGNGLRGYTASYNHDGLFVLIGRQGALCGNVNIADGKAYFTEHAVAVKANTLNETLFLYYLCDALNLGQYSGQSAQPGLAVSNLVEVEAMVPTRSEQVQIAHTLSGLDNLITLHQRKLEVLRNLKSAMLDKMFL